MFSISTPPPPPPHPPTLHPPVSTAGPHRALITLGPFELRDLFTGTQRVPLFTILAMVRGEGSGGGRGGRRGILRKQRYTLVFYKIKLSVPL